MQNSSSSRSTLLAAWRRSLSRSAGQIQIRAMTIHRIVTESIILYPFITVLGRELPPCPFLQSATRLLGIPEHALNEPIHITHHIGRQFLAFGDDHVSFLIEDRSLKDHNLSGLQGGAHCHDLILYFLRHFGSERCHGHTAIEQAAAQEDRLPGPIDHGGGQPGQRIAKCVSRS